MVKNKLVYEIINNTLPDWKLLLNILKQSKESSIPTTSLALLTGLSQIKIDKILEGLQKFKLVRKMTKKDVSFWKFIGDDGDDCDEQKEFDEG